MRGSGRFNLAQWAVETMQGVGASISTLAAGEVTDHLGYSAAFLFLASVAAVAWAVFALLMPETRDSDDIASARGGPRGRSERRMNANGVGSGGSRRHPPRHRGRGGRQMVRRQSLGRQGD